MEIKDLWIKAIGFQKENFEKTFQYVTKLQDQVELKVNEFVDGTAFVPDPVKQVYKQWAETVRKSREAIKKYTDEGYQGIENYLATTA